MEPRKDVAGQNPLLSNLLIQVGREQPQLGQLGGALLDMSRAIIEGVGNTKDVDRLRNQWSSQTRNGSNASGARDGEVQVFQEAIQKIAELREPYDSYVFYVPGGSGIVRVGVTIDGDGKPKAYLADYGGIKKAKENFEKLI